MIWALIPGKLKLYALIAGMIVLALVGVRYEAGQSMARKIEAQNNARRLKAIRDKRKIEDDVEGSSDDDALISGIVRKD